MRWLAVLAIACSSAVGAAQKRGAVSVEPLAKVGVTTRVFHPAEMRNWRGATKKELDCMIWYPAMDTAVEVKQVIGPPDAPLFVAGMASPNAQWAPSLGKFPVVLLSHGSGGSAAQMGWLGIALARAGYVAVAVDHPGNNALEPYTPEGFVLWWERATDLSQVLDGMLADAEFGARLDEKHVAAAGFSLGGYTVMELAGAETDVSVLYALCGTGAEHTELDRRFVDANSVACRSPEMKGMGGPDRLLATTRKTSGESLARAAGSFRDARVKAVFAIEPGLGFVLTADSLKAIHIPVEVTVGTEDRIAPARDNADYVRLMVRGAREMTLPGVRHYTFVNTCTAAGKATLGMLCEDEPGVDRDVVHAQVAAEAIKFFDKALKIRW